MQPAVKWVGERMEGARRRGEATAQGTGVLPALLGCSGLDQRGRLSSWRRQGQGCRKARPASGVHPCSPATLLMSQRRPLCLSRNTHASSELLVNQHPPPAALLLDGCSGAGLVPAASTARAPEGSSQGRLCVSWHYPCFASWHIQAPRGKPTRCWQIKSPPSSPSLSSGMFTLRPPGEMRASW